MPEPKGDTEQWPRPFDTSGALARKAQPVVTPGGTVTVSAAAGEAAAAEAAAALEDGTGDGSGGDLEEGLDWRRQSFSTTSSTVTFEYEPTHLFAAVRTAVLLL